MQKLLITNLDERYARLRTVHMAAQRSVRDSMRRLGQLMPIVTCKRQDTFAVVDGFKRVAAARELGMTELTARVMPLGEVPAIAALVTFNRHGRGLSDLEEALVVEALCRGHGLSQVEVAELVGRHKSWACRRLSLAERLTEEVSDDVRAGLLSSSVAREVARLPRGNQVDVATSIRRHGLTYHEAALLVTMFSKTSDATAHKRLLVEPRKALDEVHPYARESCGPSHKDPRLGPATQDFRPRLTSVLRSSEDLTARLSAATPATWSRVEQEALAPLLTKTHRAVEQLCAKLTETLETFNTPKRSHAA